MRKLLLATAAMLGATSGLALAQAPVGAQSEGQFVAPRVGGPAANNNNNSHEGVRLLIKENAARFIQQPSSEVASQAIGLLKSESVSAESRVADDEEESQMVKIDRSLMQRLFGVITASMIAVSAYAYLV